MDDEKISDVAHVSGKRGEPVILWLPVEERLFIHRDCDVLGADLRGDKACAVVTVVL